MDGERKRDCPFCILEKRIARSLRADHVQDAPAKIQSCLRLFPEHFRSGHQEDAHEFLRYVIVACHNRCLRLTKLCQNQCIGVLEATSNSTIVKEIFGGSLRSQVKCMICGAESDKVDEILDISLDIFHSGTLKDALHKFFEPEVLDGNKEEVLLEKVHILFYARTKQRPACSTLIPAANGVKSHAVNGYGASKKQPSYPPSISAHGRTVGESACRHPSVLTIADKLTSSPRVNFSISGHIASKRVPARRQWEDAY